MATENSSSNAAQQTAKEAWLTTFLMLIKLGSTERQRVFDLVEQLDKEWDDTSKEFLALIQLVTTCETLAVYSEKFQDFSVFASLFTQLNTFPLPDKCKEISKDALQAALKDTGFFNPH